MEASEEALKMECDLVCNELRALGVDFHRHLFHPEIKHAIKFSDYQQLSTETRKIRQELQDVMWVIVARGLDNSGQKYPSEGPIMLEVYNEIKEIKEGWMAEAKTSEKSKSVTPEETEKAKEIEAGKKQQQNSIQQQQRPQLGFFSALKNRPKYIENFP